MQQYISLGHDDAQLAIQAIKAELLIRNMAAVVAVADVHGEIIGLLRLDGAKPASILIAVNKAWTAARERKPSGELGQSARDPEDGFDMAFIW